MELLNWGRVASYFAVTGMMLLVMAEPESRIRAWRRRRRTRRAPRERSVTTS